jgi:hypothetical protein
MHTNVKLEGNKIQHCEQDPRKVIQLPTEQVTDVASNPRNVVRDKIV